LKELESKKTILGGLLIAEELAKKSWYKTGTTDIAVYSKIRTAPVQPLSKFSNVIGSIKENNQVLLYVDGTSRDEAMKRIKEASQQK
jgi:hypothetical protein